MGSSNRLEKFRTQHALRRGGDPGSTAPVGYMDPGGDVRAYSGNEHSGYVWSPPFQDPLQPIMQARDINRIYAEADGKHLFPYLPPTFGPPVPTYQFGTCFEPIDVADYRVITILLEAPTTSQDLFFELLPVIAWDVMPNTSTNPEAQPDLAFSPMGFVNPDVTRDEIEFINRQPYYPTETPLPINKTQSFSCRTAEPMCLRTVPSAQAGADPRGFLQLTLDFEVSSHRSFTLSIVPRYPGWEQEPPAQAGVDGELSLYYTRRT